MHNQRKAVYMPWRCRGHRYRARSVKAQNRSHKQGVAVFSLKRKLLDPAQDGLVEALHDHCIQHASSLGIAREGSCRPSVKF